MKVEKLARGLAETKKVRDEINKVFLAAPQGRVCGATCSKICPQCGSIACQCECSRDCPDAPRALSSDPENYPIEAGIAPLVFEMQRTGVFRPCWSCEGHSANDGALWKLPQVWFYCDSATHVRLLADTLKVLRIETRTRARWEIHIEFSEPDNPDTTFALRPNLTGEDALPLFVLQNDSRAIAESLEPMLRGEARKLQNGIPQTA